jgi:hypothetical protein
MRSTLVSAGVDPEIIQRGLQSTEYGGIFLPPTCKINYVNMQENYVNMQKNYVNMQVTNI